MTKQKKKKKKLEEFKTKWEENERKFFKKDFPNFFSLSAVKNYLYCYARQIIIIIIIIFPPQVINLRSHSGESAYENTGETHQGQHQHMRARARW